MLPHTITQQFKIYPALPWRQLFFFIKSNYFTFSFFRNLCYSFNLYGIDRPLFSSFLLYCCLEFWARRRKLRMDAKDFRLEREGAFPGNMGCVDVFLNPPQIQCLGLHKLKGWSGPEICLRQAGRFWQIPPLPHWASWGDCRYKHKHYRPTHSEGRQLDQYIKHHLTLAFIALYL